MSELNVEQKAILQYLVQKIKDLVTMMPFRIKIRNLLRNEYMKGIEKAEVQFNMNFLPDDKEVNFLVDYAYNNMQYHTDQLGNELRKEIQKSIIEKETTSQLKQRIKDVFGSNEYLARLKTVVRTESLRANNKGQVDAAQQLPFKVKKYVDVILDNKTSDICLKENKFYGSKEQAIPVDEPFEVVVHGEKFTGMQPPFHPNCRSVVRFVREEA